MIAVVLTIASLLAILDGEARFALGERLSGDYLLVVGPLWMATLISYVVFELNQRQAPVQATFPVEPEDA